MKTWICLSVLLTILNNTIAQNVGINEISPEAKLTVRASSFFEPSVLVKTSGNDSLFMIRGNSLYAGNASQDFSLLSVLTIANRYSAHFDGAQLNLLSTGMSDGTNTNGSLSRMMFSNSNFPGRYYLTANTDPANQAFRILHHDDISSNAKYLLYLNPSGNAGFGTYQPGGALQVNHRANSNNPTLLLADSASFDLPRLQFKNLSAPLRYWEFSGYNGSSESNNFFDLRTQTGIKLTVTGNGNLGIGNDVPTERLVVNGNVKLTGEVNRDNTTTANLVPICYGNIQSTGSILTTASTDNFTITKVATGRYNITITGETFNINSYNVQVSTIGSPPKLATTGSGAGILNIDTYNLAGVLTDASFCFVVYKK